MSKFLVTYEVEIADGEVDPWDDIREQIGSGQAPLWTDPEPIPPNCEGR